MGLLLSRKYSTLDSVKSKQGLKTHAHLWRIWISILLSLTIYLLSLCKIMASSLISPSSLSLGFPVSWWMISFPALFEMVVCLDPCTGVVLVYFWCLKNSGNSGFPLFISADLQQCKLGSRYERKEEGAQHLFENEEAFVEDINLISVAADLHPYNIFMGAKGNTDDGTDSGISQCKLQRKSDDRNIGESKPAGEKNPELKLGGCENKMTTLREVKTPITAQLNKGHNTGSVPCMQENLNVHYPEEWEKEDTKTAEAEKPTKISEENIAPTSPIIENEENQLQQLEEDMEDYEDEQFDYEFEDLIVNEPLNMDEPLNPLHIFPNDEISPILISEDPPFSEKDLEDFINNEAINGDVDPAMSEGTFHSIHNSTRSSASVVVGIERLDVHHTDRSTFTSSKRKFIDGVEDTASSGTKEGKKTKN